jgi:AraC-like DNA-binding protein
MSVYSNPYSEKEHKLRIVLAATGTRSINRTMWTRQKSQFWVLDSFQEGSISERIKGNFDVVRPANTVALYAPGTIYEELLEKNHVYDSTWIMMKGPSTFFKKLLSPKGFCFFLDGGGIIRERIKQIATAFAVKQVGFEWHAGSLFQEILFLLFQSKALENHIRRIEIPNFKGKMKSTLLREKVEDELEKSFGRLSVADIAERLGMSVSTFTHSYKGESQETFVETRNRWRIEYAKKLMILEQLPIKEAAIGAGFPNVAYFSRVFLKATSFTPKTFLDQVASKERPNLFSKN